MANIILGFSKAKSKWALFSNLIMWAEKVPYSHCYIKLNLGEYNRVIVYQASGLAINFMAEDLFNSIENTYKEFTIDVTDDHKKEIVRFCIDNVGKPYGLKDIFGLAYVQIMSWLGRKVNNPFRDDGRAYVCSELAATILKKFSNLLIDEDLNNITPKDLYRLVTKVNGISN